MDPNVVFDQIIRLDIRVRYAFVGICLVLLLALDYMVVVRLQLRGREQMQEQIKSMADETARVKTDMQRISQIKGGLEDMRSQLAMVNAKIRSVGEVPAILADISKIANGSQVTIDQLTPSKDGPQKLLSDGDIQYYMLPIVVAAHSGYHMFGRFLNKLETGNILFVVKDLRLEGSEKEGGTIAISTTINVILAERPQ